jgi:hypothetical protein
MDFFQTLAECAIAFAGLGAIHAALKGGTAPRILHRAFTIVLTGSLTFILSVIVLLLDQWGFASLLLWRIASLAGIVFGGLGAMFFYQSHRVITRRGFGPQSPLFFTIASSLFLVSIPIFVANLSGWIWNPGATAYGVALIFILASGLFALLGSFWFPLALAMRDEGAANSGVPTDDR